MRIRLRSLSQRWATRIQRLYAQAILSGPAPKRGGPPGGSLSARVLEAGLVSYRRWGFVFLPTRLGNAFRFWWRGTQRQRSRGHDVPIDEDQLARELNAELLRQIRRTDRS